MGNGQKNKPSGGDESNEQQEVVAVINGNDPDNKNATNNDDK